MEFSVLEYLLPVFNLLTFLSMIGLNVYILRVKKKTEGGICSYTTQKYVNNSG